MDRTKSQIATDIMDLLEKIGEGHDTGDVTFNQMDEWEAALASNLSTYFDGNDDMRLPMTWECEESPFGYCVYDRLEDPVMDDCVFCHDPEERK